MKRLICIIAALLLADVNIVSLATEPPTTQMTIPGKLLLAENFDNLSHLPSQQRVNRIPGFGAKAGG